MRFKSQIIRDLKRETYLVAFPPDLAVERVLAWLRSVSGTLPKRSSMSISVDSLVFETWANARGIFHRLHIPSSGAEYIASQLRTLAPGITVTKDETRAHYDWTAGIELGMSSPSRQLRIPSHNDLAASLLASIQTLTGEETVLIQWIVTPAPFERPPERDNNPSTVEFSVMRSLLGSPGASSDELQDRRSKLEEQNMLAVGRVVAASEDEKRARELVIRVESALAGGNSAVNYFRRSSTSRRISDDANDAATPLLFPAQFNLKELAAVLAWPIGQPFVAGLPQGSTRHLYATEDIPTEGRIIGDSNYPGHERPIALDYEHATQHLYIGGKTSTGKSTLMANAFAQDVNAGYGAIVIDASNSESNETMFERALSLIPEHRMDDVIIMNVSDDQMRPVGFNVLDQGNPRIVADQIKDLFSNLYQDTAGVWTKQLLFHGLYTLAERPGMTLADLMPLLNRQSKEEVAWADELTRSVKDSELRNFWQRWENFNQSERDRYTQPLLNRIWQLVSRPEARYIVGQSHSSFKMRDVLAENKILLISLSGLPADTSSILGTLLVNAVWTAAQAMKPDKANFLYLDEFQVMTRLPMGLDDMLNRARKHGLGVVLGTQYLEDVQPELKNAVINNARSRVIFQSSSKESRMWRDEFGRSLLEENDFMRIRKYEAVAQLATSSGLTTPVTLKARPPMKPTGLASKIKAQSRARYGRPIAEIEASMVERRQGQVKPNAKKLNIGIREWDA
jgi:hypothetical protein